MGKTVLITGASKGIGADIARIFAQNGYTVAVNFNNSEKSALDLCRMLKENSLSAFAVKGDVSNPDDARKIVETTVEKTGRVDVLVNNAGIALCRPFLETDTDDGDKIIKTDLMGSIYCAKYAAADMLKRKKGSIVNISSVWGICGASCETYYSAAKAGIIGFTKALAAELCESGIRVNAVAPGVVDTDMNSGFNTQEKKELIERIPAGRMANGYDIAKTVLFLASDDAEYITGQTINVSGGFLI